MGFEVILIALARRSQQEKRVYERFRLDENLWRSLSIFSNDGRFLFQETESKFDKSKLLKFRIEDVTIEFVFGNETDTYIINFLKQLEESIL